MSYGAAVIQLSNILTFHRSTIMMDARLTSLAKISIEKFLCTRFRSQPQNRCVCCGKSSSENIGKRVLNIIDRFFVLWIAVTNQLHRNLFALR